MVTLPREPTRISSVRSVLSEGCTSFSRWNSSVSLVDQTKERREALEDFEGRMRERPHGSLTGYISPSKRASDLSLNLNNWKVTHADLTHKLRQKILHDNPSISATKLQAVLWKELMLATKARDNSATDIIPPRNLFRPILTISSKSNRYKQWFHPGANLNGKWTCCLAGTSCGCDFTIVNPDSWCMLS